MAIATIYQYWVIKNEDECYYTVDSDWSPWREDALKFLTKQSAFAEVYETTERVFRVNCYGGVDIDLDDYLA